MLRLVTLTTALAVASMIGCSKDTENAKSPGSKAPPAAENTFNLEVPTGATNIAKAGDEKITIGVDRGENLKGDIALSFSPPEGITIEPASPSIPADKSDVDVTVKVGADVANGEKSIPVKGKAQDLEASGSFKVEVTD